MNNLPDKKNLCGWSLSVIFQLDQLIPKCRVQNVGTKVHSLAVLPLHCSNWGQTRKSCIPKKRVDFCREREAIISFDLLLVITWTLITHGWAWLLSVCCRNVDENNVPLVVSCCVVQYRSCTGLFSWQYEYI